MQYCLKRLLPNDMKWKLDNICNLTEIRVRVEKPLVVYTLNERKKIDYIANKKDIDYILKIATNGSIYAVEETIKQGFITCEGGIRIGISGEGVLDNGQLRSIQNINSLVIRIAKSVACLPKEVEFIVKNFDNTILLSPPYLGKTTLLREMTKNLSNRGNDVLVIDERNELSASVDGVANLDLGENTDILVGIPKVACYEGAVRTMSPDIIVTDEIFGKKEADCLVDVARCGIKFMASAHSASIDSFVAVDEYKSLKNIVKNFVLLGDTVGKIKEVRSICSGL